MNTTPTTNVPMKKRRSFIFRVFRASLVGMFVSLTAICCAFLLTFWGSPFNKSRRGRVPLTPPWALECWVWEDDTNNATPGLSVWTPEFVQVSLEWLALRAALARRRAIWLTRLFDSSVVWREPDGTCARLIVIENGEVVLSRTVDADAKPPIPPGSRRSVAARREAFTLASFDRLRVLTTELKRLIAAGAPVTLRLGVGPAVDEPRLASALWWV